jgi:hypothetical protein
MLIGIPKYRVLYPAAQALRNNATHAIHGIRLCRTLVCWKGDGGESDLASRDRPVVLDAKSVTHDVRPLVDRLAHVRSLPDEHESRHPPPKTLEVFKQFGRQPISACASTESPKPKHRAHR